MCSTRSVRVPLLLAVWLCALACADLLNPGASKEEPGTRLTGLDLACPLSTADYIQCFAWSGDSKTLFVLLPRTTDTILVALDATAASGAAAPAYRVVGPVGTSNFLRPSRDGTAIFYSKRETASSTYAIYRMSSSDGATRLAANAAFGDFQITPDGSSVVYHSLGSALVADTIVMADVASGTRRASTTATRTLIWAISPDGKDVGLHPWVYDSSQVWRTATGARDMMRGGGVIVFQAGLARWVADVGWTGSDFAALFAPPGSGITAVAATSGVATKFGTSDVPMRMSIAWASEASRVYVAEGNGGCGNGCAHLRWLVLSPNGSREVGSINAATSSVPLSQYAPSPDGRWIAYKAGVGRIYLLSGG